MPRILIIQGSPNPKSATAAMLRHLEECLRQFGAEVDFLDLRATPLPMYTPAHEDDAENYEKITALVNAADAIVLGSPDYHGSPSSVIINFLDYYWRELTGKLFGYVCASHEKGLTVMDMLRVAVRQCYGWSLPYGVSGASPTEVEPEGKVVSEKLASRINMMAHDMVAYAAVIKTQRDRDLAGDHPTFMAVIRGK